MQRSEAATITTQTTTRQELKDGQGEELKSCSILVDHVSVKKVRIRFPSGFEVYFLNEEVHVRKISLDSGTRYVSRQV